MITNASRYSRLYGEAYFVIGPAIQITTVCTRFCVWCISGDQGFISGMSRMINAVPASIIIAEIFTAARNIPLGETRTIAQIQAFNRGMWIGILICGPLAVAVLLLSRSSCCRSPLPVAVLLLSPALLLSWPFCCREYTFVVELLSHTRHVTYHLPCN